MSGTAIRTLSATVAEKSSREGMPGRSFSGINVAGGRRPNIRRTIGARIATSVFHAVAIVSAI